ncbi:MAG TPA: hypothetical protein VND22_01550 [Actinomycetota bacterium]|nr:hypothetical protein [Actinomycetota bacterium]
MTRLRLILAVTVAVVLIVDLGVLLFAPKMSPHARRNRAEAEKINQSITDRSSEIRAAQDETNIDRQTIATAFENLIASMNAVRARGGGGIQPVQDKWPTITRQVEDARRSKIRLNTATAMIIEESRLQHEAITALLDLAGPDSPPGPYRALDQAYVLLQKTHEAYALMNAKIDEGFVLYEELFAALDQFLQQERAGNFRGRPEAAQVASSRTEKLVEPLRQVQEQITQLNGAAELTAGEALRAFERAQTLQNQER